jgi:hypothetical protein
MPDDAAPEYVGSDDAIDSIDNELEDDGVLDPADSLEGDEGDDPLDEGIDAGERYVAAERFGTTLEEEREGESLDQLLAEEEPDVDPYQAAAASRDYGVDRPAGRLVEPDEGAHETEEADLVGSDVGYDGGSDSAEESAVHIVDEDNPPDV